ncbi:aldehyde dehydrogenase family protein [Methanobrevibacter olleyae]|uniref:Lactaldehyde dehydrogenase n=1 Tax=Methanobrevibacter olleyae TaxID=294671 RepID=A0A126R2D9_METOL|nr:aldehyde dehydrogenase family protein [Methanobrevibacter olleyae]AMK16149.1 aldehyde dehydrogenase [Methanobrevibacter olleyae]
MKIPENPADKEYKLYINGQWKDASDGGKFDTFCPANGEKLSTCAEATKEDVDEAVKAANIAFEDWKLVDPIEKEEILLKIADIIDDNKDKLAMIETLDNGKPIRENRAIDMPFASDHFRYFAGAVRTEEGSAKMLNNNTLSLILREPIGVVGQIVPWNFPFLMAAWKLAPVLAAGCCTVFKPSSSTPLSVLEFAKLTEKVIPKGVFNVVTGKGSKSGQYILDHPGFRKLAFTGSTEIGCNVADAAACRLIPSTLELGGKSANIYFADCKWDIAIDGLQLGILFNQGQVCCAGSRVFVQEEIYDKFVKEAVDQFSKINVNMPWEEDTQMGSQIDERQVQKIEKCVQDGVNEGATIAVGGERYTEGSLSEGSFFKPTLLTNVTNDMKVAQEEIFGPVAVVIPFKDEKDVVEMANDNAYGLGGAVWTRDINRAIRVCNAIETGRMWVNTYNSIPAGAPFGGYKQSGIGRETHKVILEHYTQMKNIMINLSEEPSGFYPKK